MAFTLNNLLSGRNAADKAAALAAQLVSTSARELSDEEVAAVAGGGPSTSTAQRGGDL